MNTSPVSLLNTQFTITHCLFPGIQEENRGRQEGVPQGPGRVQGEPGFEGSRGRRRHVRRLRWLQRPWSPVRGLLSAGSVAVASGVDARAPAAPVGWEKAAPYGHGDGTAAGDDADLDGRAHGHAAHGTATQQRIYAAGDGGVAFNMI